MYGQKHNYYIEKMGPIVTNYHKWTTKTANDIGILKLHDYLCIILWSQDGFQPFGEGINGHKNEGFLHRF